MLVKDILRFICLSRDLDLFFLVPGPPMSSDSELTEEAVLMVSDSDTEADL